VPAPPASPPGVPLARDLAGHGDRTALVHGRTRLTYAQLADRVAEVGRRLGPVRRLVLVTAAHELEAVTAHLGALAAGHVVLLVPGEEQRHVARWTERYDPDVVVARGAGGRWTTTERREGSAHVLHPELALLLSTSGSTGSPKLVRLSAEGVQANAEAIASYLGLRDDDRTATTLPMAYCYGLSVLHSHLVAGACVVLTSASVVDPCFRRLCRDEAVTSLAGVPHTFTLLDRGGLLDPDRPGTELPSLRRLTCAGGRLEPEQVRRWAAAGRERGFALFVMYGQTEATARMAYLPPELALARPEAVGVPVPGGSIRLDPVAECSGPDRGEIVYRGPNVMLGYAESASDLRLGRVVRELRTGDLARRADDGLLEVLGRRSRFAKVLGLRVDLEAVERGLAGAVACTAVSCTEAEGALVVVAERPAPGLAAAAARAAGLPPRAVRVAEVDRLPRLASGKVDAAQVRALARPAAAPPAVVASGVRGVFAEVLDLDDVPDGATFVGLGGDSLSYVELAVRLEDELGVLPPDWHVTPVAHLESAAREAAARASGPPGSGAPAAAVAPRGSRLETTVLLRAVAILLIVGSHAHLFSVVGGAHALLAVAGYNFARFRLTAAPRTQRLRGSLAALRRVVVPSVAIIGVGALLEPDIGLAPVLLLNDVLGPDPLGPPWRYWFVESLVQATLGLTLLLGVPWVDRLERRAPLGLAALVLGLGALPRLGVLSLGDGPDATQSGAAVVWLFALGWCAARARTTAGRAAVTLAALALVPGSFGHPEREGVVLAAVLLLVWTESVVLPRLLRPLRAVASVLAAASLYVYLTHWEVVMRVPDEQRWLSAAGSFALGLAVWRLAAVLPVALRRARAAAPPAPLPDRVLVRA